VDDILGAIFSGAGIGVLITDAAGKTVFANRKAMEIMGVREGALSPVEPVLCEEAAAQGPRASFFDLPGNGGRFVAHRFSAKNLDKDILVSLFIPADGTEKALDEGSGAYRQLVQQLETIVENTYDGLYVTDANANTLRINKAYERITGIRRDEVVGKNMRDLVASGVIDRSVSLEALERRTPVTIMQELRGGKKVLVTGSPVIDADSKEVVLVVTNVRDITELMELKAKLHERTLEANTYLAELDKIKLLQQQKSRFVTVNRKMKEILERAVKVGQYDSNILITGESGAGKGLIALAIHGASTRRDKPFVVINCAAIPEDLFESELFGYEPGAFSGASAKGKKGLLELADKGTIFLDEIGDMSFRLQAKLLRVIEEKEMVRLGSTRTVKLDVRIIAATNQDIQSLIEQKKFRQDLFFRLNTISVHIPPLRERTDDVLPLIQHFTQRLNERYEMKKHFDGRAIQALTGYAFPGNVRELSNVVEQAFLMSKADLIQPEDLPPQVRSLAEPGNIDLAASGKSYDEIMNLAESRLLKAAMEKYGSTHKAAKSLGVSQSTIVRKMRKLHLRKSDA
jgi:PAS domain S-box-containing protein